MKSTDHYEVIIIGLGTAGMTARREVAKKTQNYLIVHDGPLGTTCARVGCMPSKAFIQVAHDFHRSRILLKKGLIKGSTTPDLKEILSHTRSLRDRFVKNIIDDMKEWEHKILKGRARFIDKHTIEVDGQTITADKFVIATGTTPVVPKELKDYSKFLLTTDTFFELETLPESILVIGLGAIGLELGQALSRLGVHVTGINRSDSLGGLTDPMIERYVLRKCREEFPIHIGEAKFVGPKDGEQISVEIEGKIHKFDKVLLSVGRKPNLEKLGLNEIGISLNKKGLPEFKQTNLSLTEMPHIFLAGDANGNRPILHEAADDGKIAGYNAVNELRCFKRRVAINITFTGPNIAIVGEKHDELVEKNIDFVIGKVSFENQGRAITKLEEQGLLHVFVKKDDGKILGAEFQCPNGEHIAHLLAWAISLDMTAPDALKMPFYHPVLEEGLRTALRDAAKQLPNLEDELFFCDDPPIY